MNKRITFGYSIIVLLFFLVSCIDEDVTESCTLDDEFEPCESVTIEIETCCDAGICTLTYEGDEYADSDQGLENISIAAGCSTINTDPDIKAEFIARIKSVIERNKLAY